MKGTVLLAALLALPAVPANAAFIGGWDSLSGSGRFRRSELRAAVSFPWRSPELHDDPVYRLELSERLLSRRGVVRDTRTRSAVFDIDFFRQVRIGGHFWRTYVTSRELGGYRANGGGAFVSVKGNGWYPRTDLMEPFRPGRLVSEWSAAWSQEARYEHVLFPGSVRVEKKLGNDTWAFTMDETYRGATSLRLGWARRTYDQDIPALINGGVYFFIGPLQATEEPEWMHGFLRDDILVGVEQTIFRAFRVSADWRRLVYEAGLSRRADKHAFGLEVDMGNALTLEGRAEFFLPADGPSSEYTGGGVRFRF